MNEVISIIIVGIIFYLIDIRTASYNCTDDPRVRTAILLHHILNVYAQFGFLCNGFLLYAYLVTPLFVLLHWKTNNNMCILTEYVNKKCNLPEGEMFRDVWYFMGAKRLKNYDTIHKTYLVVVWVIALIRTVLSLR
jgi:hypothetical protein